MKRGWVSLIALLAATGSALGSLRESANFLSAPSASAYIGENSPGAGLNKIQQTFTGGYTARRLVVTGGTLTGESASTAVLTRPLEARIHVTPPGGKPSFEIIPLWRSDNIGGGSTNNGKTLTLLQGASVTLPGGGFDPAGTWTFEFYESNQSRGPIGTGTLPAPDAKWNNLQLRFDDTPMPVPSPQNVHDFQVPGAPASDEFTDNSTPRIRWHSFTLDEPVPGANRRYVDIDTEGSRTTGSGAYDTVMALYDSSGQIVTIDDDSGSSGRSQLTFGWGVRPEASDGTGYSYRYDGRNGDLPAGKYYVCVGPYPMNFAPGFVASTTSFTTGTQRVNVRGGVGAALLPPPSSVKDLGTLSGPVVTSSVSFSNQELRWLSFSVPQTCSRTSGYYVDIDTFGSLVDDWNDAAMVLFNEWGAELCYSDNQSYSFLPAMSMGSCWPGRMQIDPDGQLQHGNSGVPLIPGQRYYLAVCGGGQLFAHLDDFFVLAGQPGGTVVVNVRSNLPLVSQACNGSDLTDAAGAGAPDGQLTASDIVTFFASFFQGNLRADITDASGTGEPDGRLTSADVVAFFTGFFAGCHN